MKCEHMTCYQCTDAEVTTLRTTLARLTAELAAVTSDRDMWRSECESISAELDLPPGIRPAEGELRRMLGHNRALLAQVTTLTAERDEARGLVIQQRELLLSMRAERDNAAAEVERLTVRAKRAEKRRKLLKYQRDSALNAAARAAHLGRSE